MIADAELWLLRHGQAADKSQTNTYEEDYVRALTDKGARQALAAGDVLRQVAPKMTAVYCSPRVRTVQSAVLAAARLKGHPEPHREKTLLQMSPKDALALCEEGKATLIVGHGPEIDETIEKLSGRKVSVAKGGIAGIGLHGSTGTLLVLLTPADIARMARR